MERELGFDDGGQAQERVYKHLQRADWFLLFAPMVLSVGLFVIYPAAMIVYEQANGRPTHIGGFDFSFLVIIAGIVLSAIFCAAYFLLAFVLSLVTRRNRTFRLLLTGISLAVAAALGIWIFTLS
jgi:hypothetical protein